MLNQTLFHSVFQAWQQCAKHKRASRQAQCFEVHLLDELVSLTAALEQGQWQPSPPVSFILNQTKPREIHAADFKDRIVHHYLVPRLSALYEPVFIYDLHSNRTGKGTHGAVARLARFMRQQRARMGSALHSGHYLQLDIKNFFNSIDKKRVFALLQHRLGKAVQQNKLCVHEASFLRDLCHRVLKQDAANEARNIAKPFELNRVLEHKKLAYAGPNKGLPIGNLSSQFFANVLLNELDQFVKHTLKCKYYLRYVDDFVLLHHCPQQLEQWRTRIERFLNNQLKLHLRDQGRLHPINNGVDFLGYIVRPDYYLVRRRVIFNCRDKLHRWQSQNIQGSIKQGWRINANMNGVQQLNALVASYLGHFAHAKHYRLVSELCQIHFPWLLLLFDFRLNQQGRLSAHLALAPKSVTSFASQQRWFRQRFPNADMSVQKGFQSVCLRAPWQLPSYQQTPERKTNTDRPFFKLAERLHHHVVSLNVAEVGYLKDGLKKRQIISLRTAGLLPNTKALATHANTN